MKSLLISALSVFLATMPGFALAKNGIADEPATQGAPPAGVALDLVLCVDSSGSLQQEGWDFEIAGMQAGLSAALNPGYLDSKVRVTVISFSADSVVGPGPTVIDSLATLDSFTDAIEALPFQSSFTNTASCFSAALEVLCGTESCPADGVRRVIDMSTDGEPNREDCTTGTAQDCAVQRAGEAAAAGVDALNVIGILERVDPGDQPAFIANMAAWPFPTPVSTINIGAGDPPPQGGDEGFLLLADTFLDYIPTMKAKVKSEVEAIEPTLSLVKTAEPVIYTQVGDLIEYDYLVTNNGSVPLAGPVTVIDDKLTVTCPDLITVGNNDEILDPTESITCTASHVTTAADVSAGLIVNTAIAGADGVQSPYDDAIVTLSISLTGPSMVVAKTVTNLLAAPFAEGDLIQYTITVTNTGDVPLTGVTVSDPLLALSSAPCVPDPVPLMGSCSVWGIYAVTAADITSAGNGDPPDGNMYNTATADSNETEPVEASAVAPLDAVSAIFSVTKDFTDDSAATVSITVTCTDADATVIPPGDTLLSDAETQDWMISGFDPALPTICTASEVIPAGYVGDGAPPGTCSSGELANQGTPACTITNTPFANLEVTKTYSDNNPNPQNATLTCDNNATVSPAATQPIVSSGSPNVAGAATTYTINNINQGGTGTICTLLEDGVPLTGYTTTYSNDWDADPDCALPSPLAPNMTYTCGITNTQIPVVINVDKDFSDDNPMAVTFDPLTCAGVAPVDIVTNDPIAAEPGINYAQFTVSNFPFDGTSCTANEIVPAGYTASGCEAIPVALGQAPGAPNCTVLNTQIPVDLTVYKEYTDDGGAAVDVTLECTSGSIDATPKPSAPGGPAVFTLSNFLFSGANCWASEDGLASNYYLAAETCGNSGSPGMFVSPPTGGDDCTFTNAPTRATFAVNKVFSDGAEIPVEVSIDCNGGFIPDFTKIIEPNMNPYEIKWVITDFDSGELRCTVNETPLAGYIPHYGAAIPNTADLLAAGTASDDDAGCHFDAIIGGEEATCLIYNELQPVEVEVNKVWFDEHPEFNNPMWARALWSCSNSRDGFLTVIDPFFTVYTHPSLGVSSGTLWFHGEQDEDFFSVLPNWDPANETVCSVYEKIRDSSVESDHSDCDEIMLYPGIEEVGCTITNTRIYEGIPTLNQYGLAILALLMLGVGLTGIRRFV